MDSPHSDNEFILDAYESNAIHHVSHHKESSYSRRKSYLFPVLSQLCNGFSEVACNNFLIEGLIRKEIEHRKNKWAERQSEEKGIGDPKVITDTKNERSSADSLSGKELHQ